MQVDAIAVELRPRPMWEATDLGVRLVQAHARSLWRTCAPVFVVASAISLASFEISPWFPALLLFWFKPWLDRSVLFVLSRAVFGQETRWSDLWAAQRSVWWGQLPSTLLWRRLSPWRAFTQPVYQLEGQRGSARRQRRSQLLRRQGGAAGGTQFAFSFIELALTSGLVALAVWFTPDDIRKSASEWFVTESPLAPTLLTSALYAGVVVFLEPFYVAAGFAQYLNRRVQLEAWDIEQEFRRAF